MKQDESREAELTPTAYAAKVTERGNVEKTKQQQFRQLYQTRLPALNSLAMDLHTHVARGWPQQPQKQEARRCRTQPQNVIHKECGQLR